MPAKETQEQPSTKKRRKTPKKKAGELIKDIETEPTNIRGERSRNKEPGELNENSKGSKKTKKKINNILDQVKHLKKS